MRLTLPALLFTPLLSGCGSSLIAPEDAAGDAFLDRVDHACGNLNVGTSSVSDLLNGEAPNDDGAFLDETAKLSDGRVSPAGYRGMITSFYPLGNPDAALDCVLQQVD